MTENRFPKGWDEERVRKVIEYYDNQTDEEAIAEYEAALEDEGVTWFAVPNELADEVRKLLAARRSA
jgi:hypothetical protein